jgi:molybdopterin-containing oxidoreductase family iron-sulfur binding subunit
MVSCPYNARKFSFGDAQSYYPGKETTPLEKVQQTKFPKGVVSKCEFCYERLAEGLLPACVATCPAHARIFGDLDNPVSQVSILIAQKSGQPLHPQVGTKPSVYYLPR